MVLDFLNELNDSQREAVEYCQGPSLVIAGAGSGKTRVLTYKIAYLINNGMKPWNILALTFTNKAADEMKQRVGALVGNDMARYLNMGTFHSVFSKILRAEADIIGYSSTFTIYDESDSRSLIKTIIKEMQLDDKVYKPASIHSRISMAKNNLMLPDRYVKYPDLLERDKMQKIPAFSNIYSAYCLRCVKANAMDFDDLLTNTYMLFEKNESIRCKYSERFKFILVDEYQDTNSVQQKIVYQLSKDHLRVCAVGDDAQSIYAFRGANIDNILGFRSEFSGARLFKLERNYRSTQRIVQAANSLIRHNEHQIHKEVYSRNSEGNKIKIKPSYSDREEALIVCSEIKKIRKDEKCDYGDFAVLYRTNAQSRSFEEAMIKVGIPYKIYGGLSFYQRKEIKDIVAYFRMVINQNDEEAFKRIINYPKRGIGETTVKKIAGLASLNSVSLWQVICEPVKCGLSVSKATFDKLTAFKSMIETFVERSLTTDAYALAVDIINNSGIRKEVYVDKLPENVSRQENVEELLGSMQEFVYGRIEEGREDEAKLSDFLQEISLQSELDNNETTENGNVALMTVHSAKGLEFPTVFVVGLEENLFPSMMSQNSPREIEEERRLLYVAITRAERNCFLTYAKSRYRYGKIEMEAPSRFLKDIDKSLVQIDDAADVFMQSDNFRSQASSSFYKDRPYQNSRPVASQFRADNKLREVIHREIVQTNETFSPSFKKMLAASHVKNSQEQTSIKTKSSFSGIKENCVIEHERFGLGTIERLEGTGENTKATVRFKYAGVKQLLLKFARFKVIG